MVKCSYLSQLDVLNLLASRVALARA